MHGPLLIFYTLFIDFELCTCNLKSILLHFFGLVKLTFTGIIFLPTTGYKEKTNIECMYNKNGHVYQ